MNLQKSNNMKRKILEQELSKLYSTMSVKYLDIELEAMHYHGFNVYKTENCFMLYKSDVRLHCGCVVIVDTLISTKKGEGTKAIKYLLEKYPNHTIQLDCHVDNEAIEFYKKLGFKKRAWSLVKQN